MFAHMCPCTVNYITHIIFELEDSSYCIVLDDPCFCVDQDDLKFLRFSYFWQACTIMANSEPIFNGNYSKDEIKFILSSILNLSKPGAHKYILQEVFLT